MELLEGVHETGPIRSAGSNGDANNRVSCNIVNQCELQAAWEAAAVQSCPRAAQPNGLSCAAPRCALVAPLRTRKRLIPLQAA